MYILDDLGFIAHPRTGSRSAREVLVELGADRCSGHHALDEDKCRGLIKAGGVIACTTRNMFDLLVSWFFNEHYNHEGKPLNPSIQIPKFEDYIFGLVEKPRHRWFMTPMYFYGLPWCAEVIRYENLQEDFNRVLNSIGLASVELPHVGKSIGRCPDYRVYYTEAARKAVEKRWGNDLHLTNCEF